MNEITTFQSGQLPDTIEDLAKFVLVNEERSQALKAQIRAIKKVKLAKEVYAQKLAEAQEIGELTVEAGQKMGELISQIPKQSGARTDLQTSSDGSDEVRTKAEVIEDIGLERHQAYEYQLMDKYPQAVENAKQKARDNGDVVSRSQVMKEIAEEKKRAKALEEENRKLREAISSQGAENVRLKMELEKAPTREIVKEVTVEVVPDDYEESKKRLKSLESENRLLAKDREDAIEKYNKADEKLKDLERSINSPKEKALRDVEGRCIDLTTAINAFLANHGGKTIAKEEFSQLSKYEKQSLERATEKLRRWLDELLDEVEVTIA